MIDALIKTAQVALGLPVAILSLGLLPGDGLDFNVTGSLVLIVLGLGVLAVLEGFRRGHARGESRAARRVQRRRVGERIK